MADRILFGFHAVTVRLKTAPASYGAGRSLGLGGAEVGTEVSILIYETPRPVQRVRTRPTVRSVLKTGNSRQPRRG